MIPMRGPFKKDAEETMPKPIGRDFRVDAGFDSYEPEIIFAGGRVQAHSPYGSDNLDACAMPADRNADGPRDLGQIFLFT